MGGVETRTINQYPSIRLNLKRNGKIITFFNLNETNDWKASYIDEIDPTESASYTVTEVDEDGREVENGHIITLKDETYFVTINQERENEFVVINSSHVPPKEYEVSFSKVEINQTEELEGATLQIYEGEVKKGELGEKQALHTWVSTKEQKKISLKEGIYTMVEKQAPLGYEVAEEIVFKVSVDGKIEVKEKGVYVEREKAMVRMEDRKEIPPIPPTPEENIPRVPKEYEVSFSKVEINQTEELEGATLQIYEGEVKKGELGEKQALHTWVSTKEQKKISLKEGIYTMVEKQAPLGYEVAENIVFKVLSNSAIQVKENGNWIDRANSMVRMEDRKEIPPTPPIPSIPSIPPTEPNKPEEPKPEEPKPEKPNQPEEPKPEKPSKPKEPKPEKPSKPKEPKPEKPNQPENINPNDPNFLMGLYGNRNPWELENSDPNYLMGLKGKKLGQLDLQSSKNPNFGKFSIKGNIVGNGIQDSPKVVKTSDMTKLTWYVMTIILSTMAIGFYLLRRKNMNE